MGNGSWLSSPAEVLAWTFVHSIWQGLVVAFLFMLCRTVVKEPSKRYTFGLFCFAVFIGLQICTAFYCQRWTKGEGLNLPITLTTNAAEQVRPHFQLSVNGQRVPVAPLQRSLLLATAESASPIVFWITIAWIAGTWFYLFRYMAARYLLKKELDRCVPIAMEQTSGYQRLAKRLQLDVDVQYLITTQSSVPATCGWLRPRVLLPTHERLKLAGKFLDAIVLHELAHIVRRDSLTHLARTIVHSIYFFHPFVRWMDGRMTDDSEIAADEIAANALGDKKVYARALLSLEETRANILALGASGGSLKDRLLHIVASREAKRRDSSKLSILMMALCGMLAIMTCSEMIVKGASPDQKLLAWVSERNLPEAVLPSLHIDTRHDYASEAIQHAVAEQSETGTLCPETLQHLADAIHAGTPADLITREWETIPYERLRGRERALPRFGSAEVRKSISAQLTAVAQSSTDPQRQAHFARAAYGLLALDIVAVGGLDAQVWILDPERANLLHLNPRDERAVYFAVGMFNERGLSSAKIANGLATLLPAERNIAVEACAYVPCAQINFAATATTQDWEQLRTAIRSASEEVKRRWKKTYPDVVEK